MPEPRYIALWADPDVDNLVDKFARCFDDASWRWRFEKSRTAAEALDRLTYDDPEVDAILLGSIFGDPNESPRFGLLDVIRQMDPDIPIFLITDQNDPELHRAVGRANAEVITKTNASLSGSEEDSLVETIKAALQTIASPTIAEPTYTYDIEQRKLANRVASYYEKLECERPGTVAYWLFEEDLIKQIVTEKKKSLGGRSVKVLDVGCGDGRFARAILGQLPTSARVTCVDFAGQMLKQASIKLEDHIKKGNCIPKRALAQKLPKDLKEFDVVILGFGFPSYTPTAEVLREVSRVIAQDGLLFASVYNHSALAYDSWSGQAHENEPERPISTWIDRERGEIWIRTTTATPEKLRVRTYTIGHFARELRQARFQVGGYLTFPVLYSVLGCTDIAKRAETDQRGECYENRQFSFSLLEVDRALSRLLKDKGFYTVFLASKSEVVDGVARRLDFHTPVPMLQA